MSECPTCGQSVEELATKLNLADKWWTIEDLAKGEGHFLWDLNLTVEMVVPPAEAEYDSYGETTGGSVFMVLKVDGRFFKKEGYRSSYGGTEWDGPCREVRAEPKTVVVFDYV